MMESNVITRYPKLTVDQVVGLKDLQSELSMTESISHRRRMGEGGINALSRYSYSRWYSWDSKTRQLFKSHIPEQQANAALIGWYLKIPRRGFLDRMTTWVGSKEAGTIIAYSLNGDQVIRINDQDVIVNQGEGIGFHLSNIHEIKPPKREQLWACLMVLGEPDIHHPTAE